MKKGTKAFLIICLVTLALVVVFYFIMYLPNKNEPVCQTYGTTYKAVKNPNYKKNNDNVKWLCCENVDINSNCVETR